MVLTSIDFDSVLGENPDLKNSYPIVRDYFTAWKSVSEHTGEGMEPWGDETNRWELIAGRGKGKSPFIMMEVPFEAVLFLFPLAYELASKRSSPEPPTSTDFVEVMKPLGPLDWSEIKILNGVWKEKKYVARDLYTFFSWALEDFDVNRKLHDPDEVWNPKIRDDPSMSKPGRGFFSPPNPEFIRIFSNTMPGDAWPTSEAISFWTPLIPNARRMVEWQVRVDGKPRPGIRKVVLNDSSSLNIPVDPEILRAEVVQIDCIWSNWIGSESKGITLRRGDSGLIQAFEEGGVDIIPEAFIEASEDEEGDEEGDEEEDFVLFIDHGDGPIKTPPAPNQSRVASTASFAPPVLRHPYCQTCFHRGECRANWCPVKDRGVPRR